MLPELDGWEDAFASVEQNTWPVFGWNGDRSGFTLEDVAETVATDWGDTYRIGLFRLKDGRFTFLAVDHDGQDCTAWVGPDAIQVLLSEVPDTDQDLLFPQLLGCASASTLIRRAYYYGGRKGRSALRKLKSAGL